MNVVEVIVYGVLIIAFLALVGLAGYLAFDYLDYKKKLRDNLEKSGRSINFNFDISSSNFETLKKTIDENKSLLDNNITTTTNVSNYAINTSNVISNRITDTSNLFRNRFNNFYDNMGKYFEFKDGTNNIKSTTTEPNNRIFDYIFGQNTVQNLDLIAQTTAYSGLTILSDANKELEICNKTSPTKCIKMSTDNDGALNIKPAGADSIIFKNTNNSIFAKFNMNNSNIFLGGSDEATSPFYIIDNNVYAKNLNMVSYDTTNNRAHTQASMLKDPIPTKVTIVNTKTTLTEPTRDVITTKMSIEIYFTNNYILNSAYKILADMVSLYINAIKVPSFTNIQKTTDASVTNKNTDYVALCFTKPDNTVDTILNDKISYASFDQINLSSINIPAGHTLNLVLNIYQKPVADKATKPVIDDDQTITFRTFSYLQQQ